MYLQIIIIGIQILILLFAYFSLNYMKEKGKNQATKEDIGDITRQVEKIKQSSIDEYERIKMKRILYQELLVSMGVFISGRNASNSQKEQFLNAYSNAWLWASDDVLTALNHFIKRSVDKYNKLCTEEETRIAFNAVIIEMRKDAGFQNTQVDANDYQFVSFV